MKNISFRRSDRSSASWSVALCCCLLLAGLASASAAPAQEPTRWSLRYHPAPIVVEPPSSIQGSTGLTLDDGSREADFGVSDVNASQFLWFNRFAAPQGGIDLDEVQVLFPSGPEVVPGAAVQLVIFSDDDGDPANGADLLIAVDETIQVADGVTFSTYLLDPPIRIPSGTPDILIGVVNRFVVSGVSPPSRPAALDTSSSAGRSWLALWTGDPPSLPALPTDDFLDTIDFVEPGNWMIRASGSRLPVTEIPTVSSVGLAILSLLLALGGSVLLRRRSLATRRH